MSLELELEQLEEKEIELRDQLSEIRKRQLEINEELFLRKYNVRMGDIVEFRDGHKTVTGKLSRFDGTWLHACLTKKDGTVGMREVRIWDRESVKCVSLKAI